MKLFLIAALVSSTSAFSPVALPGRHSSALFSAVDSSDAVKAALAASKEFGPTSKEAALAWDIVEEMDASDNSAAYKPAVVDAEYEAKVKALTQMLTKTKEEIDQVKELADSLKGVKLAAPPSTNGGPGDSAAMKSALAAARAATEAHGTSSKEAALAWETVEEIAASASHDAEGLRAPLDEECLIELIEGCEALEKFKTALDGR